MYRNMLCKNALGPHLRQLRIYSLKDPLDEDERYLRTDHPTHTLVEVHHRLFAVLFYPHNTPEFPY